MALSNYEDLKKKIIDQSHRDDLDLQIDDFISLTEVEIKSNPNESLKLNTGEVIASAVATTGSRLVSLPIGFQMARDFSITIDDSIHKLTFLTPNQLKIRRGTGTPCFFTINANQIELDVLPDSDYTLTIKYYGEFTPLSDSNQTNIVLDKYPNIYLYGCLRQAFLYADDDQKLSKYTALFFQAISDANKSEKEARYGNNPQITVGWAP